MKQPGKSGPLRHLAMALAVMSVGLVLLAANTLAQTTIVQPAGVRTEETWSSIKVDMVGEGEIVDGSHLMSMETPKRAHDAALVPLKLTVTPDANIKKVTLIVDENPAPLAATFEFGPASANASFSTRIRINSYSFVRAVAETGDGKLYMIRNFVKASGGCSAPASKDLDAALARLGKMKLRQFTPKPEPAAASSAMSQVREAQLMIRHPNNSGFQMDQVTMLYIPPRFVDSIEVKQGNDLIVRIEGGISLSEDPNIRFHFKSDGDANITVQASDTDGTEFSSQWPITGS